MSIPKIIHYCWFGGAPLTEEAEKCIASWKKLCPDYEIMRWDESNFDVNFNAYTAEAYREKKFAFVSDVARLYALYEKGGIYFDTDVELLAPIDALLESKGFISTEYSVPTPDGRLLFVNTGSGCGAEPGNEVIALMLKAYNRLHFVLETGRLNLTTCTEYGTRVFKKLGFKNENVVQDLGGFLVLSTDYFAPLDYVTGKTLITENTLGIHYYNNSWSSSPIKKKLSYRIKCTAPGILMLKLKYHGKTAARNSLRNILNRTRFFFQKTILRKHISLSGKILFDRGLKLKIEHGASVSFGDRVESDGRLFITAAHYGKLNIGPGVYFNDGVVISCLGIVEIGDNSLFGPGVKIFDNNHVFGPSGVTRECREGCIKIGKNCWIASNAVILKGAEIGDNSVIGAGCVISGKIPPHSKVTVNASLNIEKIEER